MDQEGESLAGLLQGPSIPIQAHGGGIGISVQGGAIREGDWQNQSEVHSQSTRQGKIHYASSDF